MDTNLAHLTIADALDLLMSGVLTKKELIGAYLDRINEFEPDINAFIQLCPVDEMTVDDQPERIRKSLDGIPLAVKDLIDVAGLPTTAGSPGFFGSEPANRDSLVVERIKMAGGVIIGKTHTHEIALGVTGINPHFAPTRNPRALDRIPGGSSSGSAAAVAAGMCLGALGTDTGGSIRIPAALCGVVGLKPTYGRVSTRGVLPLSWYLDHVGPITHTVRDAAILLGVLAGHDPQDLMSVDTPLEDYLSSINGGIRGWNIALAVGDYFEDIHPDVGKAYIQTEAAIEALGARISRMDMSWLEQAVQATVLMITADAAAYHRERLEESPEVFGVDVRKRLEMGRSYSVTEYVLARRIKAELTHKMKGFFTEFDLLVTPTVPVPAPLIEGTDSLAQARLLNRFTTPFNLTGLPALSIPCGITPEGLPIGLQLVGGAWQEAKILRAGHTLENTLGVRYE
ncbi:MAG: amidase [Chloroflexota bacterium]